MSEYESDFEMAVDNDLSCKDCSHCQMNLKCPDRYPGWTCYHPLAKQTMLHGSKGMDITDEFLCNRFIMDDGEEE